MAVSQTTFEQRMTRINKGLTPDGVALRRKQRRSLKSRCMTVPFFVGAGILTGMPAYAYILTEPDMSWVLIEVQKVISMVA